MPARAGAGLGTSDEADGPYGTPGIMAPCCAAVRGPDGLDAAPTPASRPRRSSWRPRTDVLRRGRGRPRRPFVRRDQLGRLVRQQYVVRVEPLELFPHHGRIHELGAALDIRRAGRPRPAPSRLPRTSAPPSAKPPSAAMASCAWLEVEPAHSAGRGLAPRSGMAAMASLRCPAIVQRQPPSACVPLPLRRLRAWSRCPCTTVASTS